MSNQMVAYVEVTQIFILSCKCHYLFLIAFVICCQRMIKGHLSIILKQVQEEFNYKMIRSLSKPCVLF